MVRAPCQIMLVIFPYLFQFGYWSGKRLGLKRRLFQALFSLHALLASHANIKRGSRAKSPIMGKYENGNCGLWPQTEIDQCRPVHHQWIRLAKRHHPRRSAATAPATASVRDFPSRPHGTHSSSSTLTVRRERIDATDVWTLLHDEPGPAVTKDEPTLSKWRRPPSIAVRTRTFLPAMPYQQHHAEASCENLR